jgi:hypothetical protein
MSLKSLKKAELVALCEQQGEDIERLETELAEAQSVPECTCEPVVSRDALSRVAEWAWSQVLHTAREARLSCKPSALAYWQRVAEATWGSLPQAERDQAVARVRSLLGV